MIDLRSDVCSLPTEAMWRAMRSAELGWASQREDRSVNRLEELGAEMLGKAAAVLVPTCSMANLAALMSLASPGDEIAVGETAHVVTSEGMALEHIADLCPRLVPDPDGGMDAARVPDAVAVICAENTHTRSGGTVHRSARLAALRRDGAAVHLDGARLFNASVALGVPVATLAGPADTVAVSLNKGLSAPMGALLAGPAEVVATARLHLRRLGGGSLHRAGIFAAAGIIALETMVERLAEDHRRAARLADLVEAAPPDTNIVLCDTPGPAAAYLDELRGRGVLAYPHSERRIRFVTHRLIDDAAVESAGRAVRELM